MKGPYVNSESEGMGSYSSLEKWLPALELEHDAINENEMSASKLEEEVRASNAFPGQAKIDETLDALLPKYQRQTGNQIELGKDFLKLGIHVNVQNHRGQTMLIKIVSQEYIKAVPHGGTNRLSLVIMLLDLGAKVGLQDVRGRTALMEAASREFEQSSEVMRLLLRKARDQGADLNAQDTSQRTALMLAALWGRFENFQILRDEPAIEESLQRDDQRRRIVETARPTQKNGKYRYQETLVNRKQGTNNEENPFLDDARRREIVRILDKDLSPWTPEHLCVALRSNKLEDHHFFEKTTSSSKSGEDMSVTIKLYAPIASFRDQKQTKTAGCLLRGDRYPPITALSGWKLTHELEKGGWTDDVLRIGKRLGFSFPRDGEKDQGNPGQSSASHAEKQLAVQFLLRHWFAPEDNWCKASIPPVALREAIIVVSSPPCEDCERFIKLVRSRIQSREYRIDVECRLPRQN